MHIPDGVVPIAVAAGGYAVTAGITWYSLRKIDQMDDPRESIPKASLLAAAFFVASWIHIPIPAPIPVSIHLVLNGLLGAVLGWYAFPAILIGLLFQAIFFQHGGLTTLGLNAAIMGIPALLAFAVFQWRFRVGDIDSKLLTGVFGFLAGATGIALGILAFYGIMISTISPDMNVAQEQAAILTLTLAHIPLMILEGVFTALLAIFLMRVKPELLGGLREVRVG
ncbi:MAG: cobalt transporter CbiM [Chloroflexota bacterium]